MSDLAEKITQHFELRQAKWLGKAIVIVSDIATAQLLLGQMEKIRPTWHGNTVLRESFSTISSQNKPADVNDLFNRFCDKESSLSLLIGTGIFLESFDNPLLDTVYITCPISERLQYKFASLVSRYYEEKQDALIVDFVGLDWCLE